MTLTKEITDENLSEKFKTLFQNPEEYIQHAKEHAKELWPDGKKDKDKKDS